MYNRNQFLDKGAQGALENHRLAQEERKMQMAREQKQREMKELETQLFYKKQEVERMQATFDRLKREAVVREGVVRREQSELNAEQRQIKETEERLSRLDQDVTHALGEVTDRIEKEKAVIVIHQRALDGLEAQRREIEGKKESEKRTFTESLSRLLFFKKREVQESAKATQILNSNQTQLHTLESSLKQFTQEVKVLENKLRTMRNVKL